MPERYPKRFGKYMLLKPLARGGMGEIYVAASGEIDGFEKLCVIKKVLTEKADKGKANRFLDEAKVVLKLSHSNLVLTFDAGDAEGDFFIAMELVEGKDMREIWNRCVRTRTRIPLDVALHVVREIARALSYVHTYGDLRLIHRDVAPPNILMSYFGQVKLTDFGLARSVLKQEHTNPGVVFGRASYLAPEQARGEPADARSDIYSLGIVLWELLTGQQYLQLTDLDPTTALSLVRNPRPVPPSLKAPWITPELDAIVMCALAPNREQRFSSAEEMRQALSEVIIKVAPHADAERASEFLRALYGDIIREEREERERLLRERLNAIAGSVLPFDPSAPEVDMAGRIVDNRYRILRKIGEGGMGAIYAGEHIEIRKGVALKILHPVYSRQKDLVERFRREARAASRVGHPNIIDVTDFGTTEDGCAYFVMEHLEGIDLADVLSHERRIEPLRAVRIALQICGALHAAHEAGVIHRDLKPENIFLVARDGDADFVKVLDFGIARSLSRRSRRLTNPGMAMGTPEYMAPEQAIGTAGDAGANVDRRSDIYSVGALLYEMISGMPPHAGITYQEILAQRAQGLPDSLRTFRPDIPEELDRTILRALEPDPDRRFQTMAQLQYDLTKSVWGRPRAVAELLNMRELNVSTETPLGLRVRWAEATRTISPLPPSESESVAVSAPLAISGVTWPMVPIDGAGEDDDVDGHEQVSPAPRPRAASPNAGATPRPRAASPNAGATPRPRAASPNAGATPGAGLSDDKLNGGGAGGRGRTPWPDPLQAVSGELRSEPLPVPRAATPRPPNDAAPSGLGSAAQLGVRTVGTLAILSLGVAASLAIYNNVLHNVPWMRGEASSTGAPVAAHAPVTGRSSSRQLAPVAVEPYAAGRRAGVVSPLERQIQARIEAKIADGLSPTAVPEIQSLLLQLRREGGVVGADRLAGLAADALRHKAELALDGNEIEAGVKLLRVALELEPDQSPDGGSPIARTLVERGQRAMAEGRARDALRWGRKALAITGADPEGHALVADALFSLRDFAGAADEYNLALAGRPDDRTFRRNLARARSAIHGERIVAGQGRSKAKAPVAPASAAAAAEPEPAAPAAGAAPDNPQAQPPTPVVPEAPAAPAPAPSPSSPSEEPNGT